MILYLPLSVRANAAWTLAWRARHEANWGRMLDCRNLLLRSLRDPHPRIRRLAADMVRDSDTEVLPPCA